MKKTFTIVILLLLASGFIFWQSRQNKNITPPSSSGQNANNPPKPMQIQSPAFSENQNIPSKYTCDGDSVNPPLEFTNVPKSAQSLALMVNDPDAPVPLSVGGWVHWLLWNLPPDTNRVEEDSVPVGAIQGKTSSGQNTYGGPCPPYGTHRYVFSLYALDTKLTIPSYSTDIDLIKAINGHIIQQAQLVGLYSRNK